MIGYFVLDTKSGLLVHITRILVVVFFDLPSLQSHIYPSSSSPPLFSFFFFFLCCPKVKGLFLFHSIFFFYIDASFFVVVVVVVSLSFHSPPLFFFFFREGIRGRETRVAVRLWESAAPSEKKKEPTGVPCGGSDAAVV